MGRSTELCGSKSLCVSPLFPLCYANGRNGFRGPDPTDCLAIKAPQWTIE